MFEKWYAGQTRYQKRKHGSHLGAKGSSYISREEAAAKKRKLEVEYKLSVGTFEAPKCVTVKEMLDEYVRLYGREKWSFSTYDGNVSTINNYIIPTIGNTRLDQINNHFIEKYYQSLLDMPAVKSTRNMDGSGKITAATVKKIHKILRSCFRQAVK